MCPNEARGEPEVARAASVMDPANTHKAALAKAHTLTEHKLAPVSFQTHIYTHIHTQSHT